MNSSILNQLKIALLLFTILLSTNSFGACHVNQEAQFPATQGNIQFWQNLIRNSEDTYLAMAWDKGYCAISKGPHRGGAPHPKGDGSTLHITVKDDYRTCHVFNQKAPDLKTLTTCRP
ncbi:hypothetical protein [Pseudoalteromonas sp. 68 DY56-GL68]|uniref:hypothetical protein n=1 Tax=Pseudoalteromonas sp. 68 DY56-GL68 TaxID=2974919 RepID=UPI00352B7A82